MTKFKDNSITLDELLKLNETYLEKFKNHNFYKKMMKK